MRVLGVDPGSRFTGYAVIEKHGNRLVHVASGRLSVHTKNASLAARLDRIYHGLCEVIQTHQPVTAGVEGVFHHRNAASALTLGHARGVALLACRHGQLEINEYPPAVVKKMVAGSGRADKHQVQQMVRVLLSLRDDALSLDQSDALAIAICHAQRRSLTSLR